MRLNQIQPLPKFRFKLQLLLHSTIIDVIFSQSEASRGFRSYCFQSINYYTG